MPSAPSINIAQIPLAMKISEISILYPADMTHTYTPSLAVPRGLPHSVMGAPVRAGPYTLPSGHTISGNFASILQSEKVWGANAKEFDPTRFISVDGASVVRKEELIPFSVGKRICPGEGLARVEIFLFFAGLLQTFIFEAENPAKPPELRKKTGITSVPLPFSVRITNC